ncbi:RHS repeat domain-containing protein [Desulfatibacillum aliphaticivorans]|nr:RHS repeat-associated core domain-containing protein [Desulfatibacillum aliphaticivorans]
MTYAYNSVTHKLDTVTAGGTAYNYSYDANGNITACPKLEGASSISATLAIAYNVDNMPTQVVKSESGQPDVTTNFYYDGNGARVRKEVVGEGTTFYASQYYEVKNGVATKYIFGADRRIAKITDGEGIQYFSKDHLGSSTVVTDDSGAVVEQADYRPFGEDRFYTGTVATPTPYKYTDQELDESTGLYNYDARHYDPAIGRFISPDSLIPNLYDPQQLNPYAYCRNNPLIYVDPTGHDDELSSDDPMGNTSDSDASTEKTTETKTEQNSSDTTVSNEVKEGISEGVDELEKKGRSLLDKIRGLIPSSFGGMNSIDGYSYIDGKFVSHKEKAEKAAAIGLGAGMALSELAKATEECTQENNDTSQNSKKGGGKSGQKKSRDQIENAKKQYDQEKSKLDGMKSKANKTPDDKKAIQKQERAVSKAQDKLKASEIHTKDRRRQKPDRNM